MCLLFHNKNSANYINKKIKKTPHSKVLHTEIKTKWESGLSSVQTELKSRWIQ